MFWLFAAAWALAAVSLAAAAYILFFAVYGTASRRDMRLAPSASPDLPRFFVMVPAHNEAAGIADTLASIFSAEYPADKIRVITIADNCSDDTATVAASCGAEAWVRTNVEARGKGQALQWALSRLSADAYDLVAIIDADTVVDRGFFLAIAAAWLADLAQGRVAVYQGRYEFLPRAGDWFDTLTVATKAAENSFVYRPRSALRLACLLQGNGFCISNDVERVVPFAAHSVVEDAEYALTLALHGVPVEFVESARVAARMTARIADAAPQRLRWATGIFQMITVSVPKLVWAAMRRGSPRLFEAALMVLCTSRVLVVAITAAAIAASIMAGRAMVLPLALTAGAVLLCAIYLLLIFRKAGEQPFPLRPLLLAPFYVVWVAFVQLLALTGFRRARWARTTR